MDDRKSAETLRKSITVTVKFFDKSKGFGFVSPEDGSHDAFLHASVLNDTSYQELFERRDDVVGVRLTVDLEKGPKGPAVSAVYEPEDALEQTAAEEFAPEVEGVVTVFVPEHKYGLVAPEGGGEDIFIHTNMLERSDVDLDGFEVGTHVKCVVRMGLKGPIADSLEVI